MVVSATKNTSGVTTQFWKDGQAQIQQQAKSMSQQYLDSSRKSVPGGKPTVDDTSIGGITNWLEKMTSQSRQYNNELYDKQLKDATYWAQQASVDQWQRDRTAFERQQSLNQQNFNNQMSLANSASRSSGSGDSGGNGNYSSSSTAFGMNAPTPSGYSFNHLGMRGLYDGSAVAHFNSQQANTARNNALFAEASVAGDIKRDAAQIENQKHLAATNHLYQVDMFSRQAQESAAERASKERQTAMNAQSNLYGAMFSSFRSNPGDYQYWGGKV